MPRIWHVLLVVAVVAACNSKSDAPQQESVEARTKRERARKRLEEPDPFKVERERMVEDTIASRGVTNERVLEAMRSVRRHELVPPEIRDSAYDDSPLPIGFGLTISQPFIVATMTEAANIGPGDKVLEIGTGSGYQAAVLAELGNKVYTIEIHEQLGERSKRTLAAAGYGDVQVRIGDGYRGWPEAAPFDAIIVTCAAPSIPEPLLDQLVDGGKMVIPVGEDEQTLQVLTKKERGVQTETLMEVRFGPMRGEIESSSRRRPGADLGLP